MNRDYTKPHPQAIFNDTPKFFIEQYAYSKDKYFLTSMNFLSEMADYLQSTLNYGHKTIALFIIKPKK